MKSRHLGLRTGQGLFQTEPLLPSACHRDPPYSLPWLAGLFSEFFSETSGWCFFFFFSEFFQN